MENEIGVARVGVEVDSTRAESGLTRVEAAVTRTGRTIRNFGNQGERALDSVGAGGQAAAARMDSAARNMVASIERATAALNAGKKGTAEYYEQMARLRGIDLSGLTPSLTGLREAEAAQVRLAAAAEQAREAQERAAAAARQEAQAQREAAQAAAGRDQFLAGLREQIALYGQSQEAVLRYRAAQIGAAEAAEPLIRQLQEQRDAQQQVTSAAMATAQAQREMALAQNNRDTFVADLQRQADAIGRTRAELLELRAAQLGVSDQAAPFIQRLREAEGGLERTGNSARQTAAAMRGVPAQFTDIVVSLQGGQAPLTVLLQQGGQLVDMFGGVQEAAQGMGQHLLKLNHPLVYAAAAVAATGVAYYQATEEVDAYILALEKSGNQAGLTADKLSMMAESIAKGGGTQSVAAEALVQMVGAGNIAAGDMERFTKIALQSQKLLGVAVADTASAFADLGKDPVAAAQKLDGQLNYLSLAVMRQIKALQEQGEFEKAAALAQSSYADAMEQRNARIKASMGALETAWGASVGGMKKAWDTFVGAFRSDTLAEQIEKAQKAVARAQAARYTFIGGGADGAKELADRKKVLQELLDMQERMKRIGEADANKQALKEAGTRWDAVVDQYKSPTEKLKDEETRIANLGKAAGATQEQINGLVAAAREQFAKGKGTEAIDLQIAALQRRAAVEEELTKRSRMLLDAKHAAGIVAEEQYIQALETLDISTSEREKNRLQDELRLTAGKKDSQKEQLDLRGRIAALDESIATRRMQTVGELAALEDDRDRKAADYHADYIERLTGERDSIRGQVQAQLDYNATIGKSAEEIAGLTASKLEEQAADKERAIAGIAVNDATETQIALIKGQAEELRKLATAKREGAEQQVVAQGLKDLENYLDPTRAKEFGDALRDAFGGAGSAIVQMTSTLETFGQKQAEINKMRGKAADAYLNGLIDEKTYIKDVAALSREDTNSRLRGYGDMAGAAAGFFGEQSRGYKALQTASQVFHAAELAATVAELVPKGISAVLNQGTGDPYSAFGRMAAMAAIVAGLGVAIGGIGSSGGGGMSAADMQKQQGTGSVFGDVSAQSESIAASLEALEKNSDSLIPINKGMLSALRAIEASMTGLTNLVVRVPGLIEGENLGIATGTVAASGSLGDRAIGSSLGSTVGLLLGGPLGAIVGGALGDVASKLWGKTKQEIIDSGLQFGGSVRDLQAGTGFEQYASIDTTKSSWFGLKKKTSNRVETAGLGEELSTQFGLVFTNVEKALEAAAVSMGVGADHVTSVLDSLSIEMTKVSLKGLSGDELTAAISAVISKATDDMASAVFPELESFRQVGEGYAETVIRLASNYGELDAALNSLGMQFGAVGLGSLAAREHLIELAGGIETLTEQASSFADNFLTEAERLAPVQKYVAEQLAAMGLASVTTKDQFKALVLGLNVSTEAGAKQYTALMGLADAFAAVADAATESAKKVADERGSLEIELMEQQGNAVGVLAAQRAQELAALDESNRPLKERIYALQDEKSALDAVKDAASALLGNVDSAFGVLQQVIGRQRTALQDAYDAQAKALELQISAQTNAVTKLKSLADSLRSTLNGLEAPGQEAAGRQQAQAEIRAALAIARAGGPLPDADKLQQALSTIGKDASDQFGSYADYMRDFYATARDVAGLSDLTGSSLSVAEQSLAVLEDQKTAAEEAHKKELDALDQLVEEAQAQIAALKGIDTSVLTLSQAITGLASAIATAQANPVVGATSAINQAYLDALGRAPDKAGLEYWQNQAAAGSSTENIVKEIKGSTEAQIRSMYESVLGREVDGAGLSYYLGLVKSGASLDNIEKDLMSSPEYLKKLRGFAVGTNYVPQTMPALIHEGERIIPAADNRALMAALERPSRDDSAVVAELQALRAEVATLRAFTVQTAQNTGKTSDLINNISGGGGPLLVQLEEA